MMIYEELKKDHREVKKLVEQLEAAEDSSERSRLISEIRDALVPHSRAEEAVFYNALRDIDESKELVAHAYGEHVKAETILRGLQVTEAVHLNWQSGVKKFKEDLFHHIHEEEGKIFAAARLVFSEEEATMIGKAFRKLKPEMAANVVGSNVELVANLLPLRFRKAFAEKWNGDSNRRAS